MIDADKTSPTLLQRLGDRSDHTAWLHFVRLYQPMIETWIRQYPLTSTETDEVCQRVWFQLAKRMKSYQYDPTKSFRGWLRRLTESRAIDQLRRRKRETWEPLTFDPVFVPKPHYSDVDDESSDGRPRLLVEGERVHAVVRAKVSAKTWSAFWLTAIEDHLIGEAAVMLEMSYAATYIAQKRVKLRLQLEGERGLEPRLS
jgi:RNA polymerase sigma factor (sigma-70 family)